MDNEKTPRYAEETDPHLLNAMNECQWAIYRNKRSMEKAQLYSDLMTIGGASVAAAGSLLTVGLVGTDGDGDNDAAVATALVAAGGSIIALASKLYDPPGEARDRYNAAYVNWLKGEGFRRRARMAGLTETSSLQRKAHEAF